MGARCPHSACGACRHPWQPGPQLPCALRRAGALQERKRELTRAAFDKRTADGTRQMQIDDIKLLMDM